MKLKILGCGTSTGVPMPGCLCAVCQSGKSKNQRMRTSAIFIDEKRGNILIDASVDLRTQSLIHHITRVDAVLYTHAHADHILGTDDLRCFNFVLKKSIPCYGADHTLKRLRHHFDYIFNPDPNYQGGLLAQIILHEIDEITPFTVNGVEVRPFKLLHGLSPVTGYRIGDVSYATDCKEIPTESKNIIKGSRYLVLDGLRHKAHPTHLTIAESIKTAEELGAEITYLTHMTHDIDYDELKASLPAGIEPAYDGLEIPVTI